VVVLDSETKKYYGEFFHGVINAVWIGRKDQE
jgi:hypothetical protein